MMVKKLRADKTLDDKVTDEEIQKLYGGRWIWRLSF